MHENFYKKNARLFLFKHSGQCCDPIQRTKSSPFLPLRREKFPPPAVKRVSQNSETHLLPFGRNLDCSLHEPAWYEWGWSALHQ